MLKLNGYGGPQAKANEKRLRFKGWETLVSNDSSINIGGLSSQTAGEIVQSATSGDAAITAEGKALLQGKDDARICKG